MQTMFSTSSSANQFLERESKLIETKAYNSQQLGNKTDLMLGHDIGIKINQKYIEFVKMQSRIVSEFQLEQKGQQLKEKKYIQEHHYQGKGKQNKQSVSCYINEEMTNSLKETSNKFIKTLLLELTQVYQKFKSYKLITNEKIAELEDQVKVQKEKSNNFTDHFCNKFEQESTKCQNYIKILQISRDEDQAMYERKCNMVANQLKEKEYIIQRLYQKEQQAYEKLQKSNHLQKMQQQKYNDITRQCKGMSQLIQDYQTTLFEQNQQISTLKQMNQGLIDKVKVFESQIKQRDQKITTKDSHLKSLVGQKNALQTKIDFLEIQIQSKQAVIEDLKTNQQKLNFISLSLLEEHKNKAMSKIQRIREKYIQRDKIFKNIIGAKLKQIHNQNKKMKEMIMKEVFNFYHGVKMEMVLNGYQPNLTQPKF